MPGSARSAAAPGVGPPRDAANGSVDAGDDEGRSAPGRPACGKPPGAPCVGACAPGRREEAWGRHAPGNAPGRGKESEGGCRKPGSWADGSGPAPTPPPTPPSALGWIPSSERSAHVASAASRRRWSSIRDVAARRGAARHVAGKAPRGRRRELAAVCPQGRESIIVPALAGLPMAAPRGVRREALPTDRPMITGDEVCATRPTAQSALPPRARAQSRRAPAGYSGPPIPCCR